MNGELRCAAVLFDLDGVLVDSGSTVERSWRDWARRQGLAEEDVLRVCHGRTSAATIAAVAPHLDARAEAERLEALQATDTASLRVCPGAAAVLSALPASSWAVVTSGSRQLATSRLRGVGLPVPDVLVTADDVRHGKPDPEGYLAAAARLGLDPSRCVVVEDARPGVLAARAAGCRVVGIEGPSLGSVAEVDVVVANLAGLAVAAVGGLIRLMVRQVSDV